MAIRSMSHFRLASAGKGPHTELTFLTTRQLGPLTADLCVEAIGQRLDEIEDVGVTAGSFDLLLSDLIFRLDRTKEDVEANGSRVEGGLLRDESNLLAVLLDIEFRDLFAIEL